MKKVLITGANSYIGTSLEKWLGQYPDSYFVDTVDMVGDSWKEKDFTEFDTIFHVAGIAHIKETRENSNLYFEVNRDLTYKIAQKSKNDKVKQFIFLSTMGVYGIENGEIDKDTVPNPKSNYGRSKLQAEKLIDPLKADDYKIAILRPPMIYGKGCKGNYQRLAKFAINYPVFPNIENKRSMIYIDNLCEFVRLLIDDYNSGLFFPQNKEYVCTSEMVKMIAEVHGKKIWMTKLFNPLLCTLNNNILNKVFGNLVYSKNLLNYSEADTISTKETIKMTEM